MPDSFAKLRSFPGALLKHLKYYVVPFLIDEFPDRIILHGGCNDINKINSPPEKIANKIRDMAILYRGYGVNNILTAAMICRSKFSNEVKVKLRFLGITDLWKEGIHLLESGKTKLAQNFIFLKIILIDYLLAIVL